MHNVTLSEQEIFFLLDAAYKLRDNAGNKWDWGDAFFLLRLKSKLTKNIPNEKMKWFEENFLDKKKVEEKK